MPAFGVRSRSSRLTNCSALRSVCVTTSVGDDLRPTGSGLPYADPTSVAAARAVSAAIRSSSGGAGPAPPSDTLDVDALARQELNRLGIDTGGGHEGVDFVELREAEHLHVPELGVVDECDDALSALDHRPLDRMLLAVRGRESVREREPVAAD